MWRQCLHTGQRLIQLDLESPTSSFVLTKPYTFSLHLILVLWNSLRKIAWKLTQLTWNVTIHVTFQEQDIITSSLMKTGRYLRFLDFNDLSVTMWRQRLHTGQRLMQLDLESPTSSFVFTWSYAFSLYLILVLRNSLRKILDCLKTYTTHLERNNSCYVHHYVISKMV